MNAAMNRRSFVTGSALAAAGAVGYAGVQTEARAAESIEWTEETDVVVVGFGGAGGSAAVGAADMGSRVILLEKAPEQYSGGNTSVCGGNAIFSDPEKLDMFREFIKFQMPNTVTDDEINGFVDEVNGLRDWVTAHGGEVHEIPYPGVLYSQLPTAPGCAGIFNVTDPQAVAKESYGFEIDGQVVGSSGDGASLFAFLKRLCEESELVTVMYETPAKRLLFDPVTKEVYGVLAIDARGVEHRIKALQGVVLALGGFENNDFMMNTYYKPNVEIFPEGTPYNTGDGLVMIQEVGAKLRHFSCIEYGCQCCTQASREIGVAVGLSFTNMDSWQNSIIVNARGERFVSECAYAYPSGCKRPLHQKSDVPEFAFDPTTLEYTNLPMFYICDSTRAVAGPLMEGCGSTSTTEWCAAKGLYVWSDDNQAEVERGWIKKADTLEELASQLGIDPEGLVQTVTRYNGYCDTGVDEEFGREKNLTPVAEGPYYGCEISMTIINTQGGPERDSRHRVIDYDGNPVPRLYAAGEFGSIYGFLYQGSGNVAEALCGHVAGEEAASQEPWA